MAIVGGIIGYTKSQSKISLIAGIFSGLLLGVSAFLQAQGQGWGLLLGMVVTGVLIQVFGVRLAKTRAFIPAGLMIVLGVGALAVMATQL